MRSEDQTKGSGSNRAKGRSDICEVIHQSLFDMTPRERRWSYALGLLQKVVKDYTRRGGSGTFGKVSVYKHHVTVYVKWDGKLKLKEKFFLITPVFMIYKIIDKIYEV